MAIKTVILIGAGGNLGTRILLDLISASFKVTILTRASSTSTFPEDIPLIKVSDDYPESDLVHAFQGQDAVVCAIGALHASAEAQMIKAAVRAGVRRFIPAEFGLGTRDAESLRLIPAMAGKVKILDQLVASESDTFSWTAISTGVFFDWGIKTGFLHYDLAAHTALTLNDGESLFSTTSLSTIGEAVVRTLEREQVTRNKMLFIHSFMTSQNAVVAALEKSTGQKWKVESVDEKTLVEASQKKWKDGNVRGLFDIVFVRGILHSKYDEMPDFANEMLGLRELSMEEEVRRIVQA